MKSIASYLTISLMVIVFMAPGSWGGTMADYTSTEPFMAAGGVDPNLLLLIDNSASMYDLAYVDNQSYCYDASYNSSSTYAGYFEPGTWYAYNLGAGQFETKTDAEAATLCSSATYSNSDVCIAIDATPSVTAFAAKGNFLNWAAASKLDIEKKILTGGKYDSTNSRLVMESRGCLGRRFVKKVAVTDSSSNPFFLTLAVRAPEDAEKADSSDNTTRIEIFPASDTCFDNAGCQNAIDELGSESPSQGSIKSYIDDCMEYDNETIDPLLLNSMGAFNHSLHSCWYRAKHGEWPSGGGSITSIKNDCSALYNAGVDPASITPDDRGYICSGVEAEGTGFVGRCWDLVTGWTSDACVETAMMDYCPFINMPPVMDPSDQADETNVFWNIPAVLIDTGVVAQLGEPLVVLKGYIAQSTAPTGLIQQFEDDIRMGAMTFNVDGSASECASSSNISCPSGDNRDGGMVIASIDQGSSHTTSLVSGINDIEATSWTPIAETMYNAIGYYTQNSTLRLNAADFSTTTDPITAWCQYNNVLIVTDGASTADVNTTVSTFANTSGKNDGANDDIAECGSSSGSTLLDDLTYYAKHGADIYPAGQGQINGEDKQNITTHVVVAGSVRTTGSDECSPDVLLQNAAQNAGASLYQAADFSQLGDALTEAFLAIIRSVMSGTAASVVSAAYEGEGAVYQAVFYPVYRDDNGTEINWIGQLHSLFIDEYGNMREDTNGNHALDLTADKIVEVFFDETEGRTRARRDTDSDGNGVADGSPATVELSDTNYLWEAGKELAERTSTRSIYTWIDEDSDGAVDGGGTVDDDEYITFKSDNASNLRPYLAAEASGTTETTKLINYILGTDQAGYRSRTIDVDGTNRVWKLGDIIFSTPTAVSRPNEKYDFIYGDTSYRTFKTQYNSRRHVIYVGSNDGMLHAFNGGFYDKDDSKFEIGTSTPSYSSTVPSLGEELWAYIPYNLLPHLRWLADENYSHVYYMDLKPKVIDAQIFSDDSDHPGGWGTVLICGMRFGGGTIQLSESEVNYDWDGDSTIEAGVSKTFRSAYFALDITNPEAPPEPLWEFTHSDLGFTTSYPTVVHVDSSNTLWAIAFGSGPTNYNGTSTQTAKTYVINLKTGQQLTGSPLTTGGANSFMGDPMSVDIDISAAQCSAGSCTYSADVFYIGNSQGKLWRINSTGIWSAGTESTVLDLGTTKPIIAAPSASEDDDGRLWLYFGTGRFLADTDKTNTDTQSLVGVKEPLDWNDCDSDSDTTDLTIYCASPATIPSSNLLDVTNYTVYEGRYVDEGDGGTYDTTFSALVDDMKQYASDTATPRPYDGWIVNLTGGERCITKPTILGGIVTFPTFDPRLQDSTCGLTGESFLYALYYKTGTAYYESIIGYGDDIVTVDSETYKEISKKVTLGRGMASAPSLHVGQNKGARAFAQSTTGEIFLIEEKLPGAYKSRPLHWIERSH